MQRYLHHRGSVHGDLKGNNILVSKTGVAITFHSGSRRF
ncbi:hypothetical protein PC116_g409 [Phytophthora cactorum]|uniref:Uncharacterized protein n=1 Tax=Phytophthora cactorum TaxID=29920 RepID=A0A8T1ELS5_9STRA|nr:hypothetical protein PC117_g54 [Phytophthora cactorum]KAG3036325.1 hypothetical protein PC120_g314 [Phytophthora cactorum]KAG4251880.1 hypothetical protein PC116_g409 [Phytophthora cactorum]